jgi:hypothetical protein
LRDGGSQAALRERTLPADLQAIALAEAEYARLAKEYLDGK